MYLIYIYYCYIYGKLIIRIRNIKNFRYDTYNVRFSQEKYYLTCLFGF